MNLPNSPSPLNQSNPLNPPNPSNPPSPLNPPNQPSPLNAPIVPSSPSLSHPSNLCPHPPNPQFKDSQKKDGVNFVLLCQSRNMVWQFEKAYLHRPIEVIYFLTPQEFKNVSHNFKIV